MKSNLLCLSWLDADNVMNYGQILQGCAMMNILRQITQGKIVYLSYFSRGPKRIVKYYLDHYNLSTGHLFSYLKTRKTIKSFIRNNRICFSQVHNESQINKKTKNIELMICGSDQIWHPQNYDKIYFLDFGDDSIIRTSYAVSLPKTQIEKQFIGVYHQISYSLRRMNAISVREKGSVPFIETLSGKKVYDVLDPTYLVDREIWYNSIEYIKILDDYIFVYIPNGMDNKMSEFVDKIKKRYCILNVLVLITRGDSCFLDATRLKYVSVGQFLYLIKNARCVVTSSFHAVVFSTIFHSDFFCYDVPNPNRGEDIRLIDILSKLGLQERLVNSDMLDTSKRIDWIAVENAIEKNRCYSWNFINNTISMVGKNNDQ